MSGKVEDFNFSDMVSWLRYDFEKEGYHVSNTIEKYPHLPIDLFCTKSNEGKKEYCVVLVASINNISNEFQKKLLFYQYYLSLHYEPSQYKLVLAIPASAEVDVVYFNAEKKEEKEEDFYEVRGFGLWKVESKDNIDKESYKPIPLGKKMLEDFGHDIAKKDEEDEDKELLKKSTKIMPFVDRYVHDSVLGIAGFYPIRFEERYIDAKLLEKVLNAKEIIYKDDLFDITSEHLSNKGDDFKFCTSALDALWIKHVKNENYPDVHMKLEPLLRELYPKYRDHYIHQFQVFLLGALIIDGLIDSQKIKQELTYDLCMGWLLASTFHDFTYPVQKHDEYIADFFKQSLGIEESLGFLELKDNYTEYSFSACIEHILYSAAKCFNDKDFNKEAGAENFNKIRDFFYYKITQNKNHGLLSSLGLLKKFRNKLDFNHILLPAAVATALHDDEIWQLLHGLEATNKKEVEYIACVREIAPLCKLDFDDHPLAFLLILCDNIQDWGRHCEDDKLSEGLLAANICLKDIVFDSGGVTVQLFYNDTREGHKFMTDKFDMLGKIEKLLKSPKIKFVIEFWDKKRKEKTDFIFKINSNN